MTEAIENHLYIPHNLSKLLLYSNYNARLYCSLGVARRDILKRKSLFFDLLVIIWLSEGGVVKTLLGVSLSALFLYKVKSCCNH